MKSMTFHDENQKYSLSIYENKEKAMEQGDAECRLFPSLSADIGLFCRTALWQRTVTPEALRAVSFYFGKVAGWPMEEILIELESGKTLPLSLSSKANKIWVKTKICKQIYENISLFSYSVIHDAVLVAGEHPFVFVESAHPNAVDVKTAEGLRATEPIRGLPMYFGSLAGDALRLAAVRSPLADDFVCMHILMYLISVGRAARGTDYHYRGGSYRAETGDSMCAARALTLV